MELTSIELNLRARTVLMALLMATGSSFLWATPPVLTAHPEMGPAPGQLTAGTSWSFMPPTPDQSLDDFRWRYFEGDREVAPGEGGTVQVAHNGCAIYSAPPVTTRRFLTLRLERRGNPDVFAETTFAVIPVEGSPYPRSALAPTRLPREAADLILDYAGPMEAAPTIPQLLASHDLPTGLATLAEDYAGTPETKSLPHLSINLPFANHSGQFMAFGDGSLGMGYHSSRHGSSTSSSSTESKDRADTHRCLPGAAMRFNGTATRFPVLGYGLPLRLQWA